MKTIRIRAMTAAAVAAILLPVMSLAQQRGPVTNLPLPRFVSLKAGEGNARRGPDLSHRIDWVYKRRDLPLRGTAEFEHWRRVEDMDGQGGWMHYALLSGVRTALINTDMTALRAQPDADARELALLERGVIGSLQSCESGWCQIDIDDLQGWLPRAALWGVESGEVFD
jgi:SH3-like domain-containing protein